MTLHILSKQDTVLNKFIAQIRDKVPTMVEYVDLAA